MAALFWRKNAALTSMASVYCGGNIDVFEYRVHRADDLALLAVDADFRIDVELRRAGFGVDASDRTDFDAGAVVGAKVGDDVRHWVLASLGN